MDFYTETINNEIRVFLGVNVGDSVEEMARKSHIAEEGEVLPTLKGKEVFLSSGEDTSTEIFVAGLYACDYEENGVSVERHSQVLGRIEKN